MAVFRRRRGHPMLSKAFAAAAGYWSDDDQTMAYYFDDGLTMRYVSDD